MRYQWDYWGCGDECNCNYIFLLIDGKRVWESTWFNPVEWISTWGTHTYEFNRKESLDPIILEMEKQAEKYNIPMPSITDEDWWHDLDEWSGDE